VAHGGARLYTSVTFESSEKQRLTQCFAQQTGICLENFKNRDCTKRVTQDA